MPSRPAVAAIVAFWLATCGSVFHRDVRPRLAASGAPPLTVELSDEASQFKSVAWTIYRGDQRAGKLYSSMAYVDTDDSFRLKHEYRQLQFIVGGVKIDIPKLDTATRVGRAGELREQTMAGRLEVRTGNTTLGADAKVFGTVTNGVFVGRCEVRSDLGNLDEPLDPMPVPDGQAISPLQVTNRMTGLTPGRTWVVTEIDPLGPAVEAFVRRLLRDYPIPLPTAKREPLVARVSSAPEPLDWKGEAVPCWVVEYRGTDAKARTWVRAADGKVLRQEAFGMGERLRVDRDE